MPGGERLEQAAAFQHFEGPLGAGGGLRSVGGGRIVLECHARTRVDEHGHPRGKHDLVLGFALEVEVGRHERGQRAQPQRGQQQAHAPRQFRGIAAVHPEHEDRHRGQCQHQQRHLPPLREAVDQRAGDAMMHALGRGEEARQWQAVWHGWIGAWAALSAA